MHSPVAPCCSSTSASHMPACAQHAVSMTIGRTARMGRAPFSAQRPCLCKQQRRHRRETSRLAASNQQQDSPDLIERMVGALFGKKALSNPEPFGMKRIDFDKLPDQFVEMEAQAALLPCDEGEVRALRPLLARTQLEARQLRLAYDAAQHGWNFRSFHERVDSFGAALVVAVTEGGAVLGGYNPEGWISLGEDRSSNGAFLFTWPDGDTSKRAIKLPKVGGPNLAVIDKPDAGPTFGAEGLTIPLRGPAGQERLAKSRLGTYYARTPQGGRSLWGPNDADPKKAQLAELRVYVAEGGGEEWVLDGIVWKTRAIE